MDTMTEERAKTLLRSALENLLGPKLPGISGYGVALDRRTRELGLDVHVAKPRAADRLAHDLPPRIGGLPVRVSVAGPALMD
jgi:hypothetical protein